MADWSSVFEATGEEDGDWDRCEVEISRISVLTSFHDYNPLVAYFFTVNYVLGVGCLGIPYAFYQSGLVLASAVIIFVTFISYITVMFIAEVSYKGMQIKFQRNSNNPFMNSKPPASKKASGSGSSSSFTNLLQSATSTFSNYQSVPVTGQDEGDNFPSRNPLKAGHKNRPRLDSIDSNTEYENEQRGEMEVSELANEFLGPWGKGGPILILLWAVFSP
jgi:hypothetical protein